MLRLGFQVIGFGALSVFEFANRSARGPFYDVHLLLETGSAVRGPPGVSVQTAARGRPDSGIGALAG